MLNIGYFFNYDIIIAISTSIRHACLRLHFIGPQTTELEMRTIRSRLNANCVITISQSKLFRKSANHCLQPERLVLRKATSHFGGIFFYQNRQILWLSVAINIDMSQKENNKADCLPHQKRESCIMRCVMLFDVEFRCFIHHD